MKFWHEVQGRLGHLSYHVEHSSPAAAALTRPLSGHCFEELVPVSLHLLAHVLEGILHGGGLGVERLWSELSAGAAIHCVWASLEPSRTQTRHFTTDCLGQALLNINTPSYWSAEHILALWLDSRWLIVLPSEVCDVMLIIFCETFSMDANQICFNQEDTIIKSWKLYYIKLDLDFGDIIFSSQTTASLLLHKLKTRWLWLSADAARLSVVRFLVNFVWQCSGS